MGESDNSNLRSLYEDDEVKVVRRQGTSDYILATFSNFGFASVGLNFWGQRLCENLDIEAIGIVAKRANWFPAENMKRALSQIEMNDKPLVTYGHSQGAYAALKYAAALHASAVLASAPQYSIDPSVVLRDSRFTHYFKKSLLQGMEVRHEDQAGKVVLIYDPYDAGDMEHIQLLCRLNYDPTVHLPLYHLGHNMMEVLSQKEIVVKLIDCALGEGDFHKVQLQANKSKKNSMMFSVTFAEQLIGKGKAFTAKAILDRALARNKAPIPPPVLKKREQLYEQIALALAKPSQ